LLVCGAVSRHFFPFPGKTETFSRIFCKWRRAAFYGIIFLFHQVQTEGAAKARRNGRFPCRMPPAGKHVFGKCNGLFPPDGCKFADGIGVQERRVLCLRTHGICHSF